MKAASADLMARWQSGDQAAAQELFQRYAQRLRALAQSRLSGRLAGRIDPEDVVQSAYRSFFTGARDDRYALRRSGDLWRLLAAITLHKLHHQVEHHKAGKRAASRERRSLPAWASVPDREPTPAEAMALADTLEQVFRDLGPLQRRMTELRLQGWAIEEIADDVQRSERTVRRVLEQVKDRLRQEFPHLPGL